MAQVGSRLLVLVFAAGCAQATPAPAGPASASGGSPLTLGETFQLESKILGERRTINVYLPPSCSHGGPACPVLYMPDGGMDEDFPHILGSLDVSIKNRIIRPVILVGIANTERRRDLVGPTTVAAEQKAAPHAGGAPRFRRFLREELKPAIAARYRVASDSAIIGESLAGLFVLETLLVEPDLFDRYIAVDPSGWWNQQALVRSAAARFAAWPAGPRTLYLAFAEENATYGGAEVLLDALRTARPAGLTWRYQALPEHHDTIFPVAALQALRTVFAYPAGQPAPTGAAAVDRPDLPSAALPAELERVLRDNSPRTTHIHGTARAWTDEKGQGGGGLAAGLAGVRARQDRPRWPARRNPHPR